MPLKTDHTWVKIAGGGATGRNIHWCNLCGSLKFDDQSNSTVYYQVPGQTVSEKAAIRKEPQCASKLALGVTS